MDKSIAANESAAHDIFPNLNPLQIKHLLMQFKPDE
jgi:hypothetical protein